MHAVAGSIALHLQAADGYKKTGMTVALDGTEDHEIVREASIFRMELRMREKINSAVADVREEVAAGRLPWTRDNVQRLIKPYPKHSKVDAILEKMQDDTLLDEGERPYQEEDGGGSATDEDDDGQSEGEGAPGAADDADMSELPETPAAAGEETPAVAGTSAVAEMPAPSAIDVSPDVAENITRSQQLIATFESAIESFKSVGAMHAVVNMECEIRKERRRMRGVCKEDDG